MTRERGLDGDRTGDEAPNARRRRTNVLYALNRDDLTCQPDSPPLTESAA
ncbi:hypothetical protein [Mycolicibacterium sp. P9-64]|nr:hypothetical protein [Mycolicibacterium sp. P9-64]